ncbi:hypothetical protein OG455_01085 [Kitasatospora sp. NBC_01287]|uniref:hypothetical protein n=1 Tax=Kitasatospora sp. NBC_01287 TaxID=2903573 RepID=UPI00225B4A0A|nr:hypothetical protein [Kitasatospora sp. NBC_01287]MCX4744119.1 hypothetical protein [Kitasatospora sp. NBC_01287]
MNRSLLTEEFATTAAGSDGITVVTSFNHPQRGVVRCPAAPLLAAWLVRRGARVVLAALEPDAVTRPSGPPRRTGGVLVGSSYRDLDGRVVGLAAAAAADQDVSLVRLAVDTWSQVIRTRRVLVPLAPRACAAGAPVPRPQRGAAAGSPPVAAAGTGCRAAVAAWESVRAGRGRGDTVLLVGAGAGAGTGTDEPWAGGPSGPLLRVPTVEQARRLEVADPARLSYAIRPCSVIEDVTEVLHVLRARFPLIRGPHPDQWCYAASRARAAVRLAAAASDLVLLLGGEGGGGGGGGAGADDRCDHDLPAAQRVLAPVGLGDLDPKELGAAATVAVIDRLEGAVRGVGCPALGVTDLIEVLSGLGPLSVVHYRVQADVSTNIYENVPAAVTR